MSVAVYDYYDLLSRSVEKLLDAGPQMRSKLYERARDSLVSHLRAADPPASDAAIWVERQALNDAIARVEARIADMTARPLLKTQTPDAKGDSRRGGNWLGDLLARASHDETREAPPTSPVSLKPLQRVAPAEAFRTTAITPIQKKPVNRLDELNRILRKLLSDTPGVEASALISEDGLMIASALSPTLEESRVAGMTATLLNLGARAAHELDRGVVQEVIVRGENGYAALLSAGRSALLLALTNQTSKLGLVFFDMRETIRALQSVL
jgi:predicted regulator of Ras-like GTPase activity (Roadblock/LC7/MglB family)